MIAQVVGIALGAILLTVAVVSSVTFIIAMFIDDKFKRR